MTIVNYDTPSYAPKVITEQRCAPLLLAGFTSSHHFRLPPTR